MVQGRVAIMSFVSTPAKVGDRPPRPPVQAARGGGAGAALLNDDEGYVSDVPTQASDDASVSLVQSARVLEHTFRDRYNVLRAAYETRIKSLSDVIQDACASLFSDELLNEMKQDKTSSAFIPAHLSELLGKHLENERERYIHQLVSHLCTVETELVRSREKNAALISRVGKLEELCAAGRRAELSIEPLYVSSLPLPLPLSY